MPILVTRSRAERDREIARGRRGEKWGWEGGWGEQGVGEV